MILKSLHYAFFSMFFLIALSTASNAGNELVSETDARAQLTNLSQNAPLNAQEIYQKISNSIFTIYGSDIKNSNNSVLGSAVAIRENILATNCHVALAKNFITVEIKNNEQIGLLLYTNKEEDLCLIVVPEAHFNPVNIRPSKSVQIGEEVFAIGNPEGLAKTISKGIISNKYDDKKGLLLQTDAAISQGSSGGGLFDNRGNLIGLTTSKNTQGEGLGFVIPTELILETQAQEKSSANTSATSTTTNNPTIVTPVEKTNAPSLQKSESPLNKIGIYGKSSIGLFEINDSCFITIPGRNDNKELQSLSIWDPENPTTFLVFPFTISVDKAMQNLSNFSNQKEKPLQKSSSYLVLNNIRYELLGRSNKEGIFPVLFTNIGQNPAKLMVEGDFFLTQFKNLTTEYGYETIQFDLWGFSEALAAYQTNCR